jgi:hypothetical protein
MLRLRFRRLIRKREKKHNKVLLRDAFSDANRKKSNG